METINKHEILKRIDYINQQLSIRQTIPIYQRTNKQSIKLDNLLYELKQLYFIINNN
jgi:hypothetical protein